MLERNMEVKVQGISSQLDPNIKDKKPVIDVRNIRTQKPSILLLGTIILINHRTDRKERILGCNLVLKVCCWRFWNKTVLETPIYIYHGSVSRRDKLLENVELEPMSSPVKLDITAIGSSDKPIKNLGKKKMKLFLKFRMVGPMRRKEILLGTF